MMSGDIVTITSASQRRTRQGPQRSAPAGPRRWLPSGIEHCPDPRGKVGPACHRQHRRFSDDRPSSRQPHKLIGVCDCLRTSEHCVVAGSLRFQLELPPRDPDQRMEPVRRARDPGETVDRPIIAAHVLQFMDKGSLQILFVPALRIGGKDDQRAQNATGHWSRQRFMQEDFDPAAGQRLRMPPGQAKAAQRPDLQQTPDHRNHEERSSQEPSAKQRGGKRRQRQS